MPRRTSGRSSLCGRASRSRSSSTGRRTRAGTSRAAGRGSSLAMRGRRRWTRRSSLPARPSGTGRAQCTGSRSSRTRPSSRSRRRTSTTSYVSRTGTDARAQVAPERILSWDGCVNVRDLGGLPLAGGGETAYRVVVRADWLPGLSDAGRQALVDYGVSLIVDLRPEREDANDEFEPLPVPVLRQAMDPRPIPAAWDWPSMREAYLALADRYRGQLARALSVLGEAEPPAAIHCAGGRDRTGIACGMALWLAGVEPDAIAADHALSDESWAPYHDDWSAEAADDEERERRRRIAQPAGRTLVDVLEEIDRQDGIRERLLRA